MDARPKWLEKRQNMGDWLDFDLDKSVRDYEYTRRAAVQMNRVIDSGDFEDMDANMIFDYLVNRMEIVWFPDYLKRYIYEKLEMEVPFKEVSLAEYQEIISSAFTDNCAPYSLKCDLYTRVRPEDDSGGGQ